MKHLLLTLALASANAVGVRAQDVTLGPEVGFGASRYFAAGGSPRAITGVNETPGPAWRLGARLDFPLGERTSFSPALRFAYLSSRRDVHADELRWGSQWNGAEFDPTLPGERGVLFVERVYLVELPLELCRYFGEEARGLYLRGGIAPAYAAGLRLTDLLSANAGPFERRTLQRFWLGATAALGYEWSCSDRVAFYAQAGGTAQLLGEARGSRSRRWDVGLTGGVRFALR